MPPRKKVVKEPQRELTPEELYASRLESVYKNREQFYSDIHLPDPTYVMNVGDEVIIGALQDARVEEVYDGGRWYHISFHNKGLKYGQPFDHGREPRVYPWVALLPRTASKPTNFSRNWNYDNWSTTDIDGMIHRIYGNGIDSDPDYQRGYVWTLEDKQSLIHSIMQRYDIGKMVFIKREYSDPRPHHYEILDGKQRLNAIQEYLEGRFEYRGVKYHELSWQDRRTFDECKVQYIEVDEKSLTRAGKLYLFLSVNMGGVKQSAEHMDKVQAMYEEELAKEGK